MGPYWLLAHEAVNSKWLDIASLDQTHLSPFMREVQAAGVSFYDHEARPLSIREDEFGDEEEPFAIEDMAGRYEDEDDEGEDDEVNEDDDDNDDFPHNSPI